MKIDLRFVEIPYEMLMLRQHIHLVRHHYPVIVESERKRIWADPELANDGEERAAHSVASHLEDALESGVTTRHLSSAAILAVWASYESAVASIADYLRNRRRLELTMSDLRGSFLTRSQRYFAEVLRFDLHPISTDWPRLRVLGELRNALAHANGRLDDVKASTRRQIDDWVERYPGLSIVNGEYLLVSIDFADQSWSFVDELLKELIGRVKQSTHN